MQRPRRRRGRPDGSTASAGPADACAPPGLVIRGKKCLPLSFLKGPLPAAGRRAALCPEGSTPTLRLGSGQTRPLCGVLGAVDLTLRQDRGCP